MNLNKMLNFARLHTNSAWIMGDKIQLHTPYTLNGKSGIAIEYATTMTELRDLLGY